MDAVGRTGGSSAETRAGLQSDAAPPAAPRARDASATARMSSSATLDALHYFPKSLSCTWMDGATQLMFNVSRGTYVHRYRSLLNLEWNIRYL